MIVQQASFVIIHIPATSATTESDASPTMAWARAYYPLQRDGDTRSEPVCLVAGFDRDIGSAMALALEAHLASSDYFSCLCMHHLRYGPAELEGVHRKRICGVYNHGAHQLYLMANPAIVGRGNATTTYREQSVSCDPGRPQIRTRYNDIYVEWLDLRSGGDTHQLRLRGAQAACIQLALEEFEGNAHCSAF